MMKTREDAIKEINQIGLGPDVKIISNENIEIELRALTSEEIGRRKALIEYFDLKNEDIGTLMSTMINCTSLINVRKPRTRKEIEQS